MDIYSNKPRQYAIVYQWIFLIFTTISLSQGVAGTMFGQVEEEVVIFSPMEGYITLNGEPVANAKIERWLKWKDEEGERDYFSTDEKGYFSIPVKKDVVRLSKITQFVMAQEVSVIINEDKVLIWAISKFSKNEYGELEGVPVNFRCELTDEEQPMRLEDALLVTRCKWDSISKN